MWESGGCWEWSVQVCVCRRTKCLPVPHTCHHGNRVFIAPPFLTIDWSKCLSWTEGAPRLLFHSSKETCYCSIVSGISGNPVKCPDKFSLKMKLSDFLTVKTVNSWVSPEWLQQLSKDLAVKRRLHFSFIKWPHIHFRFINCTVLFSESFVKQVHLFARDS